jgi:hypothetical protein
LKLLREVVEKSNDGHQHIIVNGGYSGHDDTKCTEVSTAHFFVVLKSTELPCM